MPSQSTQIMLCGCGWLGQPLAKSLIAQGHRVHGTTTRDTQLKVLSEQGISAHFFAVSKIPQTQTKYPKSFLKALSECDVLLINIPPGRRDLDGTTFTENMLRLFQTAITQQPDVKIIFVSTTSVFGDLTGEVNEATPVAPVTASGLAHDTLEQWLLTHHANCSSVVRLAGLINDTRHPVTSLVKRSAIKQGHQVVNLVHQTDVVNGLTEIIKQWDNVSGQILHFCAPEHPTREDYYQAAARSKGLPPLKFISESSDIDKDADAPTGKIVMAQKTQRLLGFEYEFPSPFDML